ncbi:MAG TPA: hypothetical protein DCP71_12650 [Verrucomicrobiales bacterium]|jgi:hypothetical protein|nr:hypothetical protein [Verrucomicrobiales bacterium]
MDFAMDIDNNVLYWTHKATDLDDGDVRLDGSPVASSHGFGNNSREHYQGDVFCLTALEQIRLPEVSIGLAHSTRGGFYWKLNGVRAAAMPTAPFLMTDNPRLKLSFQGPVRMHPSEKWAELTDEGFGPDFFCLIGDDWLGVLLFDAQKSDSMAHLLAFSETDHVEVSATKTLFFADNPETEFGRLERIA